MLEPENVELEPPEVRPKERGNYRRQRYKCKCGSIHFEVFSVEYRTDIKCASCGASDVVNWG